MNLAGARCLVTGASGHVGARLVELLVARGAMVSALVRPQSDLWRIAPGVLNQVRLLRRDLPDVRALAGAVRDAAPEVVYHLGWYGVTAAFRNSPDQLTTNVRGSLDLFEVVRDNAACRVWVGVGSQAEYGHVPEGIPFTEATPTRPVTNYGIAKLCVGMLTERLCQAAGMRFVWVRLLAAYGPKDDERHLIPSVIRQLLREERPTLTAGEQRWDYLYIDDAAEALARVAEASEAQGIYNLGSGSAVQVRQIAELVRDAVDPTLPIGLGDLPYRPDQVMFLQADIERLCAATGWRPTVPLAEGLSRTVEWCRKHPERAV